MSLKQKKAQERTKKEEEKKVASSSKRGGGEGGGREPLVEFRGTDHTGRERGWERVAENWTLETLKELVRNKISLPDGYGLELYRWERKGERKLILEEEADVDALYAQVDIAFLSDEEVVVLFVVVFPPPAAPSASSSVNRKRDENEGSPHPPAQQPQVEPSQRVEEESGLGGEEEEWRERTLPLTSAHDEPRPSAASRPPPDSSSGTPNLINEFHPEFIQPDPRTNLRTFSSTDLNPHPPMVDAPPSPPQTSHQRSSVPHSPPPPATYIIEPVDHTSKTSGKRKQRPSSSDPSTSASLVNPPQPSKRSRISSSFCSSSPSDQNQNRELSAVASDGLEERQPTQQVSSNGQDGSMERTSRTASIEFDDVDAGRESGTEGVGVEKAEAETSSRRHSQEVDEEGYEREREEGEAVEESRSDGGSDDDQNEAQPSSSPSRLFTSPTNVAKSLLHLAINSEHSSAQHPSSSSSSNPHHSPSLNPDPPRSASPNHLAQAAPLTPSPAPNYASPSSRTPSKTNSSEDSPPSQRAKFPDPFARSSLPPPPLQFLDLASNSQSSRPRRTPHSPSSPSSTHPRLASTSNPAEAFLPLWQSTAPLFEPEELDDYDEENLEKLRLAREVKEADANLGDGEGEVGVDAAESRVAGGVEDRSEGFGRGDEQEHVEEASDGGEVEVERAKQEEMGSETGEEVGVDARVDANEVDASFEEAFETVEQTKEDHLGNGEVQRRRLESQSGDEVGEDGKKKHQRAKKRKRKNSIVERAPSSSSNTTPTSHHTNKKAQNRSPATRPPPPPLVPSLHLGRRRQTLIDLNAPGPSNHSQSQPSLPLPDQASSSSSQSLQGPPTTTNTIIEPQHQPPSSTDSTQNALPAPSSLDREVVVVRGESPTKEAAHPADSTKSSRHGEEQH